ncbi:thioesterase family protein [Filibacter tadaridae]|uniref:Thioesterase superfamily protein n=1 Tax=Filibacter tadaridae TaxID=2483811 RepID=A0A3P5XP64_9BACL|nr:thioesterase family protein [Filibacter tadaridae]VDC32687.1 Thioesterase superfamily protein [Filibacter tadaridae]
MKASYIEELDTWASEFAFSAPITVRFSETDMYGHLNNTIPFSYFEYARIEYFKHIGLMSDWLNPVSETIPVVADLQCDFVKQVFFDETVNLYVKVATIGNSSIDIHYMAKNGNGDIVFTGRGTVVQIGRRTGKSVPWTKDALLLFGLSR